MEQARLPLIRTQVLALQPASIEETELRNCDAAASTSWLAACAADGPAEQASAPLESHTAEAHRWLAKQAAHMLSQDNGQPLPAADRKEDVHHPVAHGNGHALEQGLASVDDKKGGTNTALRADSSGAGVNQEDVNGRAQATDGAQGSGAPAVADAASWLFPGLITGLQPSEAAGLLTWTAWQAALTGALTIPSYLWMLCKQHKTLMQSSKAGMDPITENFPLHCCRNCQSNPSAFLASAHGLWAWS